MNQHQIILVNKLRTFFLKHEKSQKHLCEIHAIYSAFKVLF